MKKYQFTLTQPRSLRFIAGLVSVFAAISLGADAGNEKVGVSLANRNIAHNVDVSVTSGPKRINPSKLYSYEIRGSVKNGSVGPIARTPVPIAAFMEQLKVGSSSILKGTFENPTGLLSEEKILVRKSYSHKPYNTSINGVPSLLLVSMIIEVKIAITGEVSLSFKEVDARSKALGAAKYTPLKGNFVFASDSKLVVNTAPSVTFKAVGQPAFSEPSADPGAVSVASITVWRLGNLGQEATVDYATEDFNAIAGVDYEAKSGKLIFAKGVKELTIEVPLIRNETKKTNSKFTISLSNPGPGVVFGKNTMNTVAIANVN